MFHFVLLSLGPLTLLNVLSQNFAFYWMASWNPKQCFSKVWSADHLYQPWKLIAKVS